jgi:UDP-N-acetylmuramyl pentapeptide phosphotransferase/UDP-N-acetylglucosamine-1-phosphate transferase
MVMLVAWSLSVLVIGMRLHFVKDRGLDLPGHRSLHSTPTSHGGGLGIVIAALVIGAWAGVGVVWLAGVLVLASVSLVDDWLHLPSWLRLAVHLIVAASVVFLHDSTSGLAMLVAVLLIAWAINAYNFMDGSDGLAGSMAIAGFGAYAAGFALAGVQPFALWSAAVAAASLGFLVFNWHPARIFMGDVGSIPLGFLAGGVGWYGVLAGVWQAWFPLLVFAPFMLDATATLGRRMLKRERFWEAHRDHYYQRMVRMGATHSAVCRRWAGLMLMGAGLAVCVQAFAQGAGWFALVGWAGVIAGLARRVDHRWVEYQVVNK